VPRPASRPPLIAAAAIALAVVLDACAGSGSTGAAGAPHLTLLRVAAPIEHPVWADHDGVLLGVAGARVEKVAPARDARSARSSLSRAFADIGTNVAPGIPDTGVAYVPQPRSDRVAVLRVSDLRQVGTLRDGPSPAYLATDAGADALLALSAAGRSVTAVDVRDHGRVGRVDLDAGTDAAVDGPERGRLVEYHVTGASGITHVKDGERLGSLRIPAGPAVSDETKVTRLYVAQRGTGRLLAVDSQRWGDGLRVVGQADLGAPVRYLGVDHYMLFAVAGGRLIVLDTNSYQGYASGHIPVREVIHFARDLSPRLRGAAVSGLAVGPHRVYLTLASVPYVVSIAKPGI
jgi:hypothetical protein